MIHDALSASARNWAVSNQDITNGIINSFLYLFCVVFILCCGVFSFVPPALIINDIDIVVFVLFNACLLGCVRFSFFSTVFGDYWERCLCNRCVELDANA